MNSKMSENCRICGNQDSVESSYPDAHFNGKVFKYFRCINCNSFNVFPTPSADDFKKMYGENDHTYLKDINGKLKYDFNYPFANHQGYQLQFLNQIKNNLKGKTLLDYACGSGFYMAYAQQLGANTVGIEFDEDFVSILNEKTDLNILTLNSLHQEYNGVKFDFIHLGHVLEHLSNPQEIIMTLKEFANQNTIFLIDGPLERNNSCDFCVDKVIC